jgi:hypothetical protein
MVLQLCYYKVHFLRRHYVYVFKKYIKVTSSHPNLSFKTVDDRFYPSYLLYVFTTTKVAKVQSQPKIACPEKFREIQPQLDFTRLVCHQNVQVWVLWPPPPPPLLLILRRPCVNDRSCQGKNASLCNTKGSFTSHET